MAYSLLIVEDEDNTREGLGNYIDWGAMGFELVGMLKDGREAVQYLQENPGSVHVVLSDICMESMSGLELAEYIHKNHNEIIVILLTAYRQFEYARQAISFQVMEYLLKPTKISQLKQVFAKVKQKLDEREPVNKIKEISLIEKAKKYIDKNFGSKSCSLEGVAEHVGVVPSYLSKLFRQETGETFIDYVTTVRMNKAEELLAHTNRKIHEISCLVGYDSQRHFSKVFKNTIGKLPTEYRQKEEL